MRSARFGFPAAFARLVFLFALGALGVRAPAQCSTQWLPGQGLPGTNFWVLATTTWDPDAAGPMQPVLVVGGSFTIAGNAVANHIATYDPATGIWSPLGAGIDGYVYVVKALPKGDLLAGGTFLTAGGVNASCIARWNGTSWSALGSGITGGLAGPPSVRALTTLANGDVVAGGSFTHAGGVPAQWLARWDGASWSALGSGPSGFAGPGGVWALTTLPNGDLVVGGNFNDVGGVPANWIARWDGTSWSALGSGMSGSNFGGVRSLAVLPNGDLVAGGEFTMAGSAASTDGVARWDGSNWSSMASGLSGAVHAMATLPNGNLLVGGTFFPPMPPGPHGVAVWNGTSWSALGTGGGNVFAVTTMPNGDPVLGGQFSNVLGAGVLHVARWNGTNWAALSPGVDDDVVAIAPLPNGGFVIGGDFFTVGGINAARIARWNGTSWSKLGSGMNRRVRALTTRPNGDLVAGGTFTMAGGVSANWIARWDGTSWSPLGSGMAGNPSSDGVFALATLANGDLVAGGRFSTAGGVSAACIARWDGNNWSPLGTGIGGVSFADVRALLTLPNGDLVVGGIFTVAGGVPANWIARWNGTTWSALGTGIGGFGMGNPGVNALVMLPGGDFAAGGAFFAGPGTADDYVVRWNGSAWTALGSGIFGAGSSSGSGVSALATLPNGDLVAGGSFFAAGTSPYRCLARWDGASWSTFGSLSSVSGVIDQGVFALTTLPSGDLVAGGGFRIIDGAVSAHVAQLTTTCPAMVTSYGTGCAGAGGLDVLAAATLPWVGTTFHSVASGLPANALAVEVLGLSTLSLPLSSILPQGLAGCFLIVNHDLLDFLIPSAGIAQTSFEIPNAAVFGGQVVHQQVVAFDLGTSGGITSVTSTNRLTLTIGAF